VNLTRFNLYYPEKREFFLEGYQNYQVPLGNDNQVFYTRRVGIEGFQPVSIIGGVRIFGKAQRNDIGFLNIVTAKKDTIPATDNTVFRYRREIGEQSYIGTMVTSKNNSLVSNQVVAVDGSFATAHFRRNKNLVIAGLVAKSFDKATAGDNALAYRFYVDYPNDVIDNFIGISTIQSNFNPQLGFLQRTNYDNLQWNFHLAPRVLGQWGIKSLQFEPWAFAYYRTQSTGQFESLTNETRPFGFLLKSGDSFRWNLRQYYDRLDKPFKLTDSVEIPAGKYWMNRMGVELLSFTARPIWGQLNYYGGKFYTGKIRTLAVAGGVNANKHLYFETLYIYNRVKLPQGKVVTNELVQYVTYAFSTKIDLSAFIQWNSLDDILFGNFRLHWIPRIGTDFYFVYNRGYDQVKQIDFLRPSVSSGIGKLVWRFTF
jgi:hypothetical protein